MKRFDLVGQTFGRLTVLRFTAVRNKNSYWECRCECGNITEILAGNLSQGFSRSCGCLRNLSRKDMTGKVFGHLTVTGSVGVRNRQAYWNCRCDCGKTLAVSGVSLRRGHTASCGCASRESVKARLTRHGLSRAPGYFAWRSMHARCENPANTGYKYYGARGIKVCPEWDTPAQFLSDMGPGYAPGMTVERLDVNGDYEPGNCVWLPKAEQSKNRRPSSDWQKRSRNEQSLPRGVYRTPRGRFYATIILPNANGRTKKYLGIFDTQEEAGEAYRIAVARRASGCPFNASHSRRDPIPPQAT